MPIDQTTQLTTTSFRINKGVVFDILTCERTSSCSSLDLRIYKTGHCILLYNSTKWALTIRLTTEERYIIGYKIVKYKRLDISLFTTVLKINSFIKHSDNGNMMKQTIHLLSSNNEPVNFSTILKIVDDD